MLAGGDSLAGPVDQHPAAVAGQPPRFEHRGLELLTAARLHGEPAQLGQAQGHSASIDGAAAQPSLAWPPLTRGWVTP